LPYISIDKEKIFPAALRKYQIDKMRKINERSISTKETSVKTSLTQNIGEAVGGKIESAFIKNESGLLKAVKAIATGITGSAIKEPRAEVFGSFIVAAIAEKKVFQNRKPHNEKTNRRIINKGLVIEIGSDQPLPKNEEIIMNKTVLAEYVINKTIDNKVMPIIFPSIHICGVIADSITSVILNCFSPVMATN